MENLATERLILRKLTVADAPEMYKNWASSSVVTKYLPWAPHPSVVTVTERLAERAVAYETENLYDWGMVLQKTGELMGTITVVQDLPEVKTFEVGYVIGEKFWGHGYTTEAMKKVIAYLFETTDCQRIEAKHDAENAASGRVMEKAGMTHEGILKKRILNNRGIVDGSFHAILRSEWEKA